jgi:sulfur-carrier protein adenylyltransferase/sulfurtransferase
MKRLRISFLVSFLLAGFMLSLTWTQIVASAGPPSVVMEMVEKAKAAVRLVTAAEVKEALDKKEQAVFLDVRDSGEFAAGHLPGAINVSRGTLEFKIWDKVPDQNAKIYVYCLTAMRSALAAKTLNDLGYKNAVLMNAYFEEWIQAGYPVEK